MAEIKVELQAEDINKAVSAAIVQSVLGDTIVKMVNDYVAGLTRSYDNTVKKLIEEEVKQHVIVLIQERLPEIHLLVQKQLSPDLVNTVVASTLDKIKKIY